MAGDPIRKAFDEARRNGRAALVPFVTIGHPSVELTVEIVKEIERAGADAIELGVPFSDPLAEGPTIQKSSFHALQQGVTPDACIRAVARLRSEGVKIPFIFMGYYNPILAMGIDTFCGRASEAGVNGLIVVDLPTAEAGPLLDAADRHGLAVIPLLALTSTDRAIAEACRRASGFIYCVSVLGVTGARSQMSERVEELVRRVRSKTDLPVAVGFGISTAEHLASVARYADGAAVGSALVNAIADGPPESAPARAGAFIESLVPGTKLKAVAK